MRASENSFLKRFFKRLAGENSGNAILLVSLGLPMLIGGAGLGVDLAQWYMWKRELQYAVDQAAVAGAWARTDAATEGDYQARALKEFDANLSVTDGMTTAPVVGLALYSGGVKQDDGSFKQNSVTVHATVSHLLPFTGFLIGAAPQIYAYAQAAYEEGTEFTSCLVAVDEHTEGAIIVGGNTVLTAGCGMMALSDAPEAITVDGNPTVDLGKIISAGGIDDWFKENTDDVILENQTGLFDPFKTLQPPNPVESRGAGSYVCTPGKVTSTATQNTGVTTTYTYWKGADPINNPAGMTEQNYNNRSPNTKTNATSYVLVDGVPTDATTTTTTWTKLSGQNANTNWEKKVVVTDNTYTGIVTTTPPGTASVKPGTFVGGIRVSCDTVFTTGVYIIDGGGLDITGQYTVTGSNVMFVLKNGADIDIRGGANINLTAIQASDLIARGIPDSDANKLAGMLVFEDRNSQGSSKDNLNGNANTILNGKIYLPKSNMDFSGTASVTAQCLMIASATIRFVGTSNMSTFCPEGASEDTVVGRLPSTVKLVA
jgi:Flp pilus assembly protein TadG